MPAPRPRHFFVYKKKQKKSPLWFVPEDDREAYREEFLRCGYAHMVRKYHIARGDLMRLLGKKPRPIKNAFYVLIRDPQVFERVREEYYDKRSREFVEKYRIGMRQARGLFGIKHWNKVKKVPEPRRPAPSNIPPPAEHTAYWLSDDYWQSPAPCANT